MNTPVCCCVHGCLNSTFSRQSLDFFSLNKHATNCECTCANRVLYFGVMVQCVSVETSQQFGMELISLSLLSLLLLGFQLGSGGIERLFMMPIINFSNLRFFYRLVVVL